MSQIRHYNLFALQGDADVNDQEVCDTLGLDPNLANTPEINEAAIAKMYKENYNGYIAQGMKEEDALAMAHTQASGTRNVIKEAMKRID